MRSAQLRSCSRSCGGSGIRNPAARGIIEQDFGTIAPYTIEEAYEVAGAIEEENWPALKEELGDLLLQVVFHAQMASERGLFDFADVVECDLRQDDPPPSACVSRTASRHRQCIGADAAWEEHKARERAAKAHGVLDDVPAALPALLRALKLQQRASSVGFDWDSAPKVVEKIAEEAGEIVEAQASGAPREKLEDEIGDLLFAVANLARHLEIDPESALRSTNAKFVRRFHDDRGGACQTGNRALADASLDEMEALWQAAKASE